MAQSVVTDTHTLRQSSFIPSSLLLATILHFYLCGVERPLSVVVVLNLSIMCVHFDVSGFTKLYVYGKVSAVYTTHYTCYSNYRDLKTTTSKIEELLLG